jgi:hypothetical protein
MPETKQRRRSASPSRTRGRGDASRRRTSNAKPGRFSRGLPFRTEPEPTGIKRVLGALTGSKWGLRKGGAAAGGLALLAGGLSALRKRRGGPDASAPKPVTQTEGQASTPIVQPVTPHGS